MKYLKLYENFIQTDSEIHELCKKYGIENYTINNGLVDVDGDVDLSSKKLTKLPIKFGNVSGHFNCVNNQLTTLEGAPESVGGDFNCAYNQLTSLKGGPQKVGDNFYCSSNQLTTLEGAPKSVGGIFNCKYNKITSLEGCPESVGGGFYCPDNQLTSLDGLQETICLYLDCSINNIYKLDFVPNYKGELSIYRNPFYKVWKLIENAIGKDSSLFDIFIEDAIIRDPGYQGDTTGLPIIILDRLNDFLDLCKLPNVEEVEGYTCI